MVQDQQDDGGLLVTGSALSLDPLSVDEASKLE